MNSGQKQYKSLEKLATGSGLAIPAAIGTPDQRFLTLCASMISELGGSFVPVRGGTLLFRKASYLWQLAITIGATPNAPTDLSAAYAIWAANNDAATLTTGGSSSWRVFEFLNHAVLGAPLSGYVSWLYTDGTNGQSEILPDYVDPSELEVKYCAQGISAGSFTNYGRFIGTGTSWAITSQSFEIEMLMLQSPDYTTLFSRNKDGNAGIWIGFEVTDNFYIQLPKTATTFTSLTVLYPTPIPVGDIFHLRIVKSGTTVTAYANGVACSAVVQGGGPVPASLYNNGLDYLLFADHGASAPRPSSSSSIAYFKFTIGGVVKFESYFQEGSGNKSYDIVNGGAALTYYGTISTLWDCFFEGVAPRNVELGYKLVGSVQIPTKANGSGMADGTALSTRTHLGGSLLNDSTDCLRATAAGWQGAIVYMSITISYATPADLNGTYLRSSDVGGREAFQLPNTNYWFAYVDAGWGMAWSVVNLVTLFVHYSTENDQYDLKDVISNGNLINSDWSGYCTIDGAGIADPTTALTTLLNQADIEALNIDSSTTRSALDSSGRMKEVIVYETAPTGGNLTKLNDYLTSIDGIDPDEVVTLDGETVTSGGEVVVP